MNDQQPSAGSIPVAQCIAIAMLAWALVPSNPYGYYILLRIVICIVSLYLAFRAYELRAMGWVWALGVAAAVYNPVIRVHLNRELWSVINVATIAMFAWTIWAIPHQPEGGND